LRTPLKKTGGETELAADKPPKSIYGKMDYYKKISDNLANGKQPSTLGKNTELQ